MIFKSQLSDIVMSKILTLLNSEVEQVTQLLTEVRLHPSRAK